MISQIAIMIFGASAIWFVSRKEEWKRWGYILGLLGQPFWIYESYSNEQWGILIMTLFYAYSWSQGIWNYWILPEVEKSTDARIKKLKKEAAWKARQEHKRLKQEKCDHKWVFSNLSALRVIKGAVPKFHCKKCGKCLKT